MQKSIGKYTTSTSGYLGNGSLGRVEKAKDSEKNIDVVLKAIPKNILKDDEAIQLALFDEIKLLQKIKNQKIVELLDVFLHDGTYYIVMEYSQQNLQQYLKKDKEKMCMSEQEAIKMLNDLLEGFTELNQHGRMHRGLKLSNIMVNDGVFKLADCSLTKCLESFRKEQQQLSQYQYMSPQILKNEKYTNKCDIWSIGIILYQVLYGYTPWFETKIDEYINKLWQNLLQFPDDKKKISNEMKSFIEGCLAIEEEERFDWDAVYKHKLVSEHFKNYQSEIKNNQIKFLMNEVRQKIIKQNIDVVKLFKELDVDGNDKLAFRELQKLLKNIDMTISNNDCKIIFKQLDLNDDKSISFDEFAEWLTDNNTKIKKALLTRKFHRQSTLKNSTSPLIQPQQPKQITPQSLVNIQTPIVCFDNQINNPMITLEDLDSNPFEDICNQRSPEQTILLLKDGINQTRLNLKDIFIRFDQNRDGFINFQEFFTMAKQINQQFTNEELRIAFKVFDLNDDNYIKFEEFKDILAITIQRPNKQNINFSSFPLQNQSAPFFGTQYQTQPQQPLQPQQPQQPQQLYQNNMYQNTPQYNQFQQGGQQQYPQQQQFNSGINNRVPSQKDLNIAYQLMNY
ncbi:unnamed protein product [Paramecium sonneborni]|uniref:Calcium-dependent protein kinase n=1 Tax=Paramecium sonneborni TaxID=65129 RepID=A0A8S1QD59_9CILI|nr:unnamed protein product [Paramecium sonneborni]